MDAVGEHAIGMLLGLMNNFNRADAEVRNGIWKREANRGYELKGKTIGIIGYGFMGGSFARKLSGFDVNVIAYDKYKTGFSDQYVREVSMEEMVKQADVVSFHVPLTPETNGLVNDEYLFHFRLYAECGVPDPVYIDGNFPVEQDFKSQFFCGAVEDITTFFAQANFLWEEDHTHAVLSISREVNT